MRHFPPDHAPTADLAVRRCQTTAMLRLGRVHALIEQRVRALFADVGLDVTPAQSNVLMVLFQAKASLTAREIATQLGLSEPTVSRFLKALEAAGWVAREPDPQDARARLVTLTAQARDALPRFIQVSNTLLDAVFEGFSHDEMQVLAKAVARITDNLEG